MKYRNPTRSANDPWWKDSVPAIARYINYMPLSHGLEKSRFTVGISAVCMQAAIFPGQSRVCKSPLPTLLSIFTPRSIGP